MDTTTQIQRLDEVLALKPWPREMSLISAIRNVMDAKDDVQHALTRATTHAEVMQLYRICEDVHVGFDHLSKMALRKAERLQQEQS